MSEYFATVTWQRDDQPFTDNRYSRGHSWQFDGGLTVPASSSPHVVPLPMSVEVNVDPEEAFVASLSSCHMLFFLAFAAKQKLVVDSYIDQAVGLMEKGDDGRVRMTRVTLRPQISFSGTQPARAVLEQLHHQAHEHCFLANSVTCELVTEIID
ncbi:OsmC family protein [Marinobacterium arenosum]|uniref:OsmC family protein n=1 Tax=Marinobacterium arenosum TaxID=2862496 RepID=UPI001C942159|nr:OsmC family protein [Marinobacterium arenosum]MBY4676486.1 OsmC family protein [Marinobacterium arenosum]